MAKGKEVAAADEQSKAVAVFEGYGDDVGSGFENQTQADLSIPFLAVLQSNSPQVKPEKEGGLKGAQMGMLFNTVTEQLIDGDEGLIFVPAYRDHVFVEWKPRDQGGGVVGTHLPESDIVKRAKQDAGGKLGKLKLPNGNDLVETHYVYGVDVANGTPLVVAFTSTKITVFKHWNTKLNFCTVQTPDGRKQKPPLFAHQVRITSEKQSNSKGEFYNFKLTPANETLLDSLLKPNDPLYAEAKNIAELIKSGAAKADFSSQSKASGTGGDEGPAPSGLRDDDGEDIPF